MNKQQASVSLPYGNGFQETDVPKGWSLDLVAPMGPADLPEPERVLREALDHPIGSPPLADRLAKVQRVLLLLSDKTRKEGKETLLPWLIQYLREHGLGLDQIDLLFCLGTHRSMSDEELEQMVGTDIVKRHRCFQHDCDGPVRRLGCTPRGTPVALNARLWDYDLLMPVTGVVHHYFAGFGGGWKQLVPGAASRLTIQKSHELTFRSEQEGGGRRPGVGPGNLEGNAVAEDFIEAVQQIDRPIFLVDVVRGSRSGRFTGIWAGELLPTHRHACRIYLGWKTFNVDKPYDLVLSASGGYPTDSNLIQAHKGLVGAMRLVRPGGVIVHLSACQDGLGGDGLEKWIQMSRLTDIEAELRRQYVIYGQTIYSLKEKAAAARIFLVSALEAETVQRLGMTPAASLTHALLQVVPTLPPNHRIALFPDGGGMLPIRSDDIPTPLR